LEDDRVVAAISLSTPTIRMDKKHENEVQAALLDAAASIARRLQVEK
jgi:DNA-binding IclR family transcriptional regulator